MGDYRARDSPRDAHGMSDGDPADGDPADGDPSDGWEHGHDMESLDSHSDYLLHDLEASAGGGSGGGGRRGTGI